LPASLIKSLTSFTSACDVTDRDIPRLVITV
jgi:hypothetical protein